MRLPVGLATAVLPGGLGEDPFAQKGSQKEIGGIENFGVSRPPKRVSKGS